MLVGKGPVVLHDGHLPEQGVGEGLLRHQAAEVLPDFLCRLLVAGPDVRPAKAFPRDLEGGVAAQGLLEEGDRRLVLLVDEVAEAAVHEGGLLRHRHVVLAGLLDDLLEGLLLLFRRLGGDGQDVGRGLLLRLFRHGRQEAGRIRVGGEGEQEQNA